MKDTSLFMAEDKQQTNKYSMSLTGAVEYHLDNYFAAHAGEVPESGLYDLIISEIDQILIQKTLNIVNGTQVKASKILGINRNTLRKKISQYAKKSP